jgi:hypothetical protein
MSTKNPTAKKIIRKAEKSGDLGRMRKDVNYSQKKGAKAK